MHLLFLAKLIVNSKPLFYFVLQVSDVVPDSASRYVISIYYPARTQTLKLYLYRYGERDKCCEEQRRRFGRGVLVNRYTRNDNTIIKVYLPDDPAINLIAVLDLLFCVFSYCLFYVFCLQMMSRRIAILPQSATTQNQTRYQHIELFV